MDKQGWYGWRSSIKAIKSHPIAVVRIGWLELIMTCHFRCGGKYGCLNCDTPKNSLALSDSTIR